MFPFRRKSTISCQELADILAPKFAKGTVKIFEGENGTGTGTGLGLTWINESDIRKYRKESLREWVLFSLTGYINGCRSSMKQDAIHFEFIWSFITVCGSYFVEHGVFTSGMEFEQLAKERMSGYLNTLKGDDAEKEMQIIARKFLVNVRCEPDAIDNRIAAVGFFMTNSIATKKMFNDLQKSYRFVSSVREK